MHSIQSQTEALLDNFRRSDDKSRTTIAGVFLSDPGSIEALFISTADAQVETVVDVLKEMARINPKKTLDNLFSRLRRNGPDRVLAEKALIATINENFTYVITYLGQMKETENLDRIKERLIDIAKQNRDRFFQLRDSIQRGLDKSGVLLDIVIKTAKAYSVDVAARLIIELKYPTLRNINEPILSEMAKNNLDVYRLMSRWRDKDEFDRREILRGILANIDARQVERDRPIARPQHTSGIGYRPFAGLRDAVATGKIRLRTS